MNIYYLFNSGFSVETGKDALVFDYYRGRLNKPWRAPLNERPVEYRGVYVFASHIHGDHFNPEIFEWQKERADIHYILSDDIKPVVTPAAVNVKSGGASLNFLGEGDYARVGSLDIRAFGSTDAGVSFHVTAEDGAGIFHAGDFNFWHWREMSTDAEVEEAEALFVAVLDKIKLGVNKIDVAFFPVDPRLGKDYYRGAVRFCEAMKPALLVPMHFSTKFAPPPGFFNEINRYTNVAQVGPGPGMLNI